MDPGQDDALQASTFPLPPPFYKLYAEGPDAGPPPPPPLEGTFQVFDRMMNTAEPLVSTTPNAMIERRPDGSIDIKGQLLSLNQEVLFLFLELIRALVEAPSEHAGQLSRVNQALNAMQHLTNLLRPFQARVTLEHTLKCEIREKEAALERLKAQVESLDSLLLSASQALVDTSTEAAAAAAAVAAAAAADGIGADGVTGQEQGRVPLLQELGDGGGIEAMQS